MFSVEVAFEDRKKKTKGEDNHLVSFTNTERLKYREQIELDTLVVYTLTHER